MGDEPLKDRLARLDRERRDADRLYNDALTALDRAEFAAPEFPHPPPAYDASKLADVNAAWDILPHGAALVAPDGAPLVDGSLRGRLRAFIWRLVGPPLDAQRRFNAALVDHLNRNVAAHEEAARASASTIGRLRDEAAALAQFRARLMQYLQTVTVYVDSKDRATEGGAHVMNAAFGVLADDWMRHRETLAAHEARLAATLASFDDVRATTTLAQQTALSLKRDVELLLAAPPRPAGAAAPAPAPDLNAFKYLGFEDAFRGSLDDIRARLADYAPLFDGAADVLDVGCGRGEFLGVLKARGVSARGLDSNHAMAEDSRARGLDVVEADALEYLRGLPDGSLGGLFASQVIEHLPPDYLMSLLETAGHKLRPGAPIVLETINPTCWLAFFESYIRDLTHVRPIHPETLQYLLRVSGFHDVRIEFKSPVAESVRLQTLPAPADTAAVEIVDAIGTFNENVAKLNGRLFTDQDYAAIGRR